MIIGLVAGLIVPLCIYAIDKKLDDPVGALSAHGIAGIWGTLSCGIFTAPRFAEYNAFGDPGLVYTGSFGQLGKQALGVVVVFAFVFSMSFATFWLIKKTYGLRVSEDEEDAGLDISEHGMYGYPEQFIPAPELIGYTAPEPSIAAVTGRTGMAQDALHHRLDVGRGDHALDLELGPQVVGELRAAIALGDPLLASRALHLGDRDAREAALEQFLTDRLERLMPDVGDDHLHAVTPSLFAGVAVVARTGAASGM